jgi:hypothetical protein
MEATSHLSRRLQFDGDHQEQCLEEIRLASYERNLDDGEELGFSMPPPEEDDGAVRYSSVMELEANGYGGWAPASAASVASLETHKYGSACAADDGADVCVICTEDFEVGDDLSLLPCKHRHRFHRSCIARWLARSRLCPLCRQALPAAGTASEAAASSQ